jgi:hypothetical protein
MMADPVIFQPLGAAASGLVDDTRTWVDPNGYQLSDRVWTARAQTRRAIDQRLVRAVALGESPIQVAKELEQYLSPSWAPQRDATGRLIADQPKRIVTTTPLGAGAGSNAARRLMRTEISRAFEVASQQASALNPFVTGRKWNLSATHDESDICNDHAGRGSGRPFGRGEYALSDFPRLPAHPNCRCYGTPVTPNNDAEIIASLRKDYNLDGSAIPQERQPATTIKEAERNAKALGFRLEGVYSADDLPLANFVIDAMTKIPAEDRAAPAKIVLRGLDNNSIAEFDGETKNLNVNKWSPFWQNPTELMQEYFDSGYIASPNPHGIIYHEIGHAAHRKDAPRMWYDAGILTSDEIAIAREQVSRYSASDPLEFVAEVYHGRLAGKTYSPDVDAIYRKYKGPE